MIKNVICDWCGTLVDDLPAVWRATNHVFQLAGADEMTLEQFRREFVLPFAGFYQRLLPGVPLSRLESWFHAAFSAEQATVGPMPHAEEFLMFCRERRLNVFVLSAIHARHFAVHARQTGFLQYVDRPYVGVRDKREKILELLADHRLEPTQTLMVGDMQHDIETAKRGGTHSCGVLTGFNRLDQLRQSKPDLIVEHLGELCGRILRLTPQPGGFNGHPFGSDND